MNNYRFSGSMPEVGFVQVDIEAKNVSKAKTILKEKYDDFTVFGVSPI